MQSFELGFENSFNMFFQNHMITCLLVLKIISSLQVLGVSILLVIVSNIIVILIHQLSFLKDQMYCLAV